MVNHLTLRAWVAAAIPPSAWYLLQQGWGEVVRQACHANGPALIGGFVCAAIMLLAIGMAWPARRAPDPVRFVALIAIGEAGVFGLAVAFQLLAGFIVPPCWR
jgi:hypothetical protein